ncbi:MAG: PIN domain-containing protein [Magnetococcales bacterium]|nr:PIN domain-containing protein [Magnetococcales bacterium]
MIAKRFTLDTNILLYAMDRDAGQKRTIAAAWLERAVNENGILTLQALGEFFRAATAKNKMPATEASEQIMDWMTLFPVHSATPSSLTQAIQAVRNHKLSFWDAMLWACAKEAGCTLLVSEDFQHGRILEGVQFLNPFLSTAPES